MIKEQIKKLESQFHEEDKVVVENKNYEEFLVSEVIQVAAKIQNSVGHEYFHLSKKAKEVFDFKGYIIGVVVRSVWAERTPILFLPEELKHHK